MSTKGVFKTKLESITEVEYLTLKQSAKSACVFLHGYGASMQDLYDLHQLSANCDWYFPNAPIAVPIGPMMQGYAWFPIDMHELQIAMQRGEFRNFSQRKSLEFDAALEALVSFVEHLQTQYEKVIVGGFSQGAMLASHLFSRVKSQGLVLMSGVLVDQEGLELALKAAKDEGYEVSFIQGHGQQDPVLDHGQAKDLYELLTRFGHNGEFISFHGGHEIPYPFYAKIKEYFDSAL